jgi:hypothetical protein
VGSGLGTGSYPWAWTSAQVTRDSRLDGPDGPRPHFYTSKFNFKRKLYDTTDGAGARPPAPQAWPTKTCVLRIVSE